MNRTWAGVLILFLAATAHSRLELVATTGTLLSRYPGERDGPEGTTECLYFLKLPAGTAMPEVPADQQRYDALTAGGATVVLGGRRGRVEMLVTGSGTLKLQPAGEEEDEGGPPDAKPIPEFRGHILLQPPQGYFTHGVQNEDGTIVALDEHILSNTEAITVLMSTGAGIRVCSLGGSEDVPTSGTTGHHNYLSVRKIVGRRLLVEELTYGGAGSYHVCYWAELREGAGGELKLKYIEAAGAPQDELRFPDEPLSPIGRDL